MLYVLGLTMGAAVAALVLLAVLLRDMHRFGEQLNTLLRRTEPEPPEPDTVVRADAPHGPATPGRQWTPEEIDADARRRGNPF